MCYHQLQETLTHPRSSIPSTLVGARLRKYTRTYTVSRQLCSHCLPELTARGCGEQRGVEVILTAVLFVLRLHLLQQQPVKTHLTAQYASEYQSSKPIQLRNKQTTAAQKESGVSTLSF